MKKRNSNKKLCPFFEETCHGTGCMLFHENFEKCQIELLAYNAYLVADRFKPETDNQ